MKTIRQLVRGNIRQYGMIMALVVLVIFFQFATNGVLLRPMNVTNLVMQNSFILVMAIGMMLVIITGYVDLSIGSVVATTGAIAAVLMVDLKMPVYMTIAVAVVMGLLIGAFHGLCISAIGIPPFITTLAGMLIFRGICWAILDGRTVGPFPKAFANISSGYLTIKIYNGNITAGLVTQPSPGRDILSLLLGACIILYMIFAEMRSRQNKKKNNLEVMPGYLSVLKLAVISGVVAFFSFMLSSYVGVPIVLCIVIVLAVFYTFLMNNTIIGRHIYAVGGNQASAKLSGINVPRTIFFVFVNMGLMASLTGMLIAGRLNAATPSAGNSFELDAIAACYVGGASTSGGIGTIVGGIVGAMFMGVLNNGMSIMGIAVDWQRVIKGFVLLLAVMFDIFVKKKNANA